MECFHSLCYNEDYNSSHINQEKLPWIETICNIFPKYMSLWRDLHSQVQGHGAQGLLLWALHCVNAGNPLPSAYRLTLHLRVQSSSPHLINSQVKSFTGCMKQLWWPITVIIILLSIHLVSSAAGHPQTTPGSWQLSSLHLSSPAPSLTHSVDSGLNFQGNHNFLCHPGACCFQDHVREGLESSKSPTLPAWNCCHVSPTGCRERDRTLSSKPVRSLSATTDMMSCSLVWV